MGNMFTFVLLFFVVMFGSSLEAQQRICSPQDRDACKTKAACVGVGKGDWDNNGFCSFPTGDIDEVKVSTSLKATCEAKGGIWNTTTKPRTCDINGKKCPTAGMKQCIEAAKMPPPSDVGNMSEKCGPNTTGEKPHPVSTDNPTAHNDCTCEFKNSMGVYGSYVAGNKTAESAANCPDSDQSGGKPAVTKDGADATGLACIQEIRDKINKCKAEADNAVKTCDTKSEKNAATTQGITSLSQMSQQLIHVGTSEQCKNMGLVSGAAGYGLSQLQTNCRKEMEACENTCSELKDYTHAENIKAKCATSANEDAAQLQKEANELATVMVDANKECITDAEALLKQVGNTLASMTQAYAAAARCENQVSTQAVLTQTDLNTCIANPNAAGCPVNCATNPTNAQCTCLTNPNAAGCKKGTGAELAGGNPNGKINSSPINIGSNFKPKGGLDGGPNLDLGDEETPVEQKPVAESGKSDPLFGQANAGGGGGGGGGGSSGGGDKKAKGGEAEEEKGMFGGVFQNLKNAAGSLFGSGGSSGAAAKKAGPSSGTNAAGLKPVTGNKALRGLASNGKSCFVDAKGTEFCFGKKNMDIFKMMNSQYNNQYNTLILDK